MIGEKWCVYHKALSGRRFRWMRVERFGETAIFNTRAEAEAFAEEQIAFDPEDRKFVRVQRATAADIEQEAGLRKDREILPTWPQMRAAH